VADLAQHRQLEEHEGEGEQRQDDDVGRRSTVRRGVGAAGRRRGR
jgi:hypothetical protein